ncbi:MAG TPA: MarR family winged helix-turn-helix transcriptional regulator [Kribbellaceae bacterium]
MKDSADRHVERWRNWEAIPFDEEVEAAVVRMDLLVKHLRRTKTDAIAEVGLQAHEYDTLHVLMIRDTPGHATPSELARDLMVSPAGITGRLDSLEKSGYLRRIRVDDDRRRVDVEITDLGFSRWQQAMHLRGHAEEQLLTVLSPTDRKSLNRLLKKMLLHIEHPPS